MMEACKDVVAVIIDASPEHRIHTWGGSVAAPLALVQGLPLIQRLISQLVEVGIAKIFVGNASSAVRKVLEKTTPDGVTIVVLDIGNEQSVLAAVLDELHAGPCRLLVAAANIACSTEAIRQVLSRPTTNWIAGWRPSPETAPPRKRDSEPCLCLLDQASVDGPLRFWIERQARLGRNLESLPLPARSHKEFRENEKGPAVCVRIEDAVDLEIANFLLAPAEERYARVSGTAGGYWSRPIAEHLLLCNPFFPPQSFFDQLAARLPQVLRFYPSGHEHLARRVGEMTRRPPQHVAVGNGVADLIQALYAVLDPYLAIPTPTFNGFQIALPAERVFCFLLREPLFDLDVNKFGDFARERGATAAVVINPNNPSGRLVASQDLRRLARVLESAACRLIVDESFIDFPANGRAESIEPYLSDHPNLIVLKSLGKVYGLGGMRLGYMLSADEDLVATVRDRLPLWNVNGIGEYALWLLPEYEAELLESLHRIRIERENFEASLRAIDGMQVTPSATNYVFCRLPDEWPTGTMLKRILAIEHNILIRECAYQAMRDSDRYIRLTVRSSFENNHLVSALHKVWRVVPQSQAKTSIGGSRKAE
ncbi:histidinol-phosphate transaminase [Rhizobium sp. 007]|uniref:pyridoxal phosphate-dependent aminotransferase n=1 Tax=Rhizobium sp. 007 TaxID=2785056 RepID=UPI00188E1E04|nr:histidinol-phosphate transaminase [Rhizobium sp. 007]QPB24517.1 histidinol-phosphate aminotransferase family protein [Rhizobium sp. 007]